MTLLRTIFIEGMDGTGKSTLASQIAQRTGRHLITLGGKITAEEAPTYLFAQLQFARQGGFVVDRCTAMSQLVYGLARGDQDLLTSEFAAWLTEVLPATGASLVYCRTEKPLPQVSPHDDAASLELVETQSRLIRSLYEVIFVMVKKTGVPVYSYDMAVDTPAELIARIQGHET